MSVKAALGHPYQTDSSPDIVDKDSFWVVRGARQVAARVLQVGGVPWTLPPFQWPS